MFADFDVTNCNNIETSVNDGMNFIHWLKCFVKSFIWSPVALEKYLLSLMPFWENIVTRYRQFPLHITATVGEEIINQHNIG